MGEEQLHLSARLRALADLVPTGSVLADIGTDHAWIPADLLQRGRIQSAIALDIGVGPLARAAANLASLGLSEVVSLRQSDGFVALKPGEADCVLIAGMGGQLMQNILTRGLSEGGRPGPAFRESVKRYVFSPHTEWESFRTYLAAHDFQLTDEQLLVEDGKYYVILVCENGDGEAAYREALSAGFSVAASRRFGPGLLLKRHPLLRTYLQERLRKEQLIFAQLPDAATRPALAKKREELCDSLTLLRETLARFED